MAPSKFEKNMTEAAVDMLIYMSIITVMELGMGNGNIKFILKCQRIDEYITDMLSLYFKLLLWVQVINNIFF